MCCSRYDWGRTIGQCKRKTQLSKDRCEHMRRFVSNHCRCRRHRHRNYSSAVSGRIVWRSACYAGTHAAVRETPTTGTCGSLHKYRKQSVVAHVGLQLSWTHRCGYVETIAELSFHHNIVGAKEASGDISRVAALRSLCERDFILLRYISWRTYILMNWSVLQ